MGITWDPDIRLTEDPGESVVPTVCASDSEVHVAWRDDRDGNTEIYYKRSTDGGLNWEEDVRLTSDDSLSWRPSIGSSGTEVFIVWQDNRDQNTEIYFKSSIDAGSTWGGDKRLTNGPNESIYPNLAVAGSSLFLVWVEVYGDNREIYFKCSLDAISCISQSGLSAVDSS